MTNEEEIRQKLQAATKLLMEIMVMLPAAAPPLPPMRLVWNEGEMDSETRTPAYFSELKKISLRSRDLLTLNQSNMNKRQKRYFWNSHKRSYQKCRNFLELYSD